MINKIFNTIIILFLFCGISFAQNLRERQINVDLTKGMGVNADMLSGGISMPSTSTLLWAQNVWDGTGTNISTTSFSGSITISSHSVGLDERDVEGDWSTTNTPSIFDGMIRQKIVTGIDVTISSMTFAYAKFSNITNGSMSVSITDKNMSVIVSSIIPCSGMPQTGFGYKSVDFVPTQLSANTTYYILFSSAEAYEWNTYMYIQRATESGSIYDVEYKYYEDDEYWTTSYYSALYFVVYATYTQTASYTSNIKKANYCNLLTTFTVYDSQPSGTSISYYIKTSTATDDFSAKSLIPISNGSSINISTVPYIQFISTLTSTDCNITPRIDSAIIQWESSELSLTSSSSSYTSESMCSTNRNSWGYFIANDTAPTGSNITYSAVTATSTYNLTTNTPFSVSNGNIINSSTGPYIVIISSLTRTDVSVTPKIYSIAVKYFNKYIRRKPMTDDN
jgi:hypothetical protein